jgi:hypothetical protein
MVLIRSQRDQTIQLSISLMTLNFYKLDDMLDNLNRNLPRPYFGMNIDFYDTVEILDI